MSKLSPSETDPKAKGHRLHCMVVTPEKTLVDEIVDFVAIPLDDGELGILPGRAPLIGRLGYGGLRTRSSKGEEHYLVEGGFAQVRDDVVTVLTTQATPAAKIDTAAASKDLEIARAKKDRTEAEFADKTKAIALARAKLRVAGKESSPVGSH